MATASQPFTFDQTDVENVLARMSPEAIDELTFGAIEVDGDGKILYYSAREGVITGRDPRKLIGRSFFGDVAPCTRRPEFLGRFVAGVRAGHLCCTFEYVFDYKMNPTKVSVHMKSAVVGNTYWILIQRL